MLIRGKGVGALMTWGLITKGPAATDNLLIIYKLMSLLELFYVKFTTLCVFVLLNVTTGRWIVLNKLFI